MDFRDKLIATEKILYDTFPGICLTVEEQDFIFECFTDDPDLWPEDCFWQCVEEWDLNTPDTREWDIPSAAARNR